ncbi:MAG: entericidin A/B family lipoprotein [Kiloniellales bacterium]
MFRRFVALNLGICSSLLLLLAATVTLPGCNTMEGAGKDIEAAGDAISDTAEDAKE